jgi:hypothetical protein
MSTFVELKKRCNDGGIYQLRKGESLQDALDYLDGKIPSRVGHKTKSDSGRKLSRNEVIAESNKESFSKGVTIPEYVEFDGNTKLKDAYEDQREDETKDGVLEPCMYCGKAIRIDAYEQWDILNCEDCMGVAILKNCM